jgi:type IV pilus assembly protein PilV
VRSVATLRARQRGLLLIEVLVAVAVFSFGVLGAMTLQALAIRHVADAHHRAEAAHLAHALVARLWAEDTGTLADRFDMMRAGPGYRDFSARALSLPGGSLPGVAPDVRVAAGPSPASRAVAIAVRWQIPGATTPHQYATTAVVGRN